MARPMRPTASNPYLIVENMSRALAFCLKAFGGRVMHSHFKLAK